MSAVGDKAAKGNRLLQITGLRVNYGAITAVRSVSLEVGEGEVVALIGPNGAGKSTVMKAIIGLSRASAGRIAFMGKDVTRMGSDKIVPLGISYVPEGSGVLPLMSVLENLWLGAIHYRGDPRARLEEVLQRFPLLRERKDQQAGTLSGGERQVLAIARALMSAPKLLMLDEPSLGLAPKTVSKVFTIIRELKAAGHTILLSEQNARQALQHADRAYVFQTGEVVLEGPGQELLNDPEVHRTYLGG
jgi:branched-chain amino acid transport system ATP-binding protein